MSARQAQAAAPAERPGTAQTRDQGFSVDYMIVGTQKGGTTALDSFLSRHPDICTAFTKETHFFCSDEYFDDGEPDYEKYHQFFFFHYAGQRIVGEATPNYMYHPRIGERLRSYNPALKLIFVLRHPAERAYSHYCMKAQLQQEPLSFSEALRREEARLSEANGSYRVESPIWWYSYASRGFYMDQINAILRSFPREQLLFLRTEDLMNKHRETLEQVYDFLGVDAVDVPEHETVFAQEYQPMPAQDRDYLLALYSQEIDELEAFLGWDLSDWRR